MVNGTGNIGRWWKINEERKKEKEENLRMDGSVDRRKEGRKEGKGPFNVQG